AQIAGHGTGSTVDATMITYYPDCGGQTYPLAVSAGLPGQAPPISQQDIDWHGGHASISASTIITDSTVQLNASLVLLSPTPECGGTLASAHGTAHSEFTTHVCKPFVINWQLSSSHTGLSSQFSGLEFVHYDDVGNVLGDFYPYNDPTGTFTLTPGYWV